MLLPCREQPPDYQVLKMLKHFDCPGSDLENLFSHHRNASSNAGRISLTLSCFSASLCCSPVQLGYSLAKGGCLHPNSCRIAARYSCRYDNCSRTCGHLCRFGKCFYEKGTLRELIFELFQFRFHIEQTGRLYFFRIFNLPQQSFEYIL